MIVRTYKKGLPADSPPIFQVGREDGKTTDCRDFRLLKIPWAHHGRKWLHPLCNEISHRLWKSRCQTLHLLRIPCQKLSCKALWQGIFVEGLLLPDPNQVVQSPYLYRESILAINRVNIIQKLYTKLRKLHRIIFMEKFIHTLVMGTVYRHLQFTLSPELPSHGILDRNCPVGSIQLFTA